MRGMLWEEWRNSHCMLRETNPSWARCSVRCVKNDDGNGALVGWWMCEELCFSRAQEVCFLTLQILPSPLISCLPCSAFDPGKNTNAYPPIWKEWEYLHLSKWWKHGSQQERERMIPEVQPWRNPPAAAETGVDAWVSVCVFVCQQRYRWWKTVSVWGEVRANPDGL